MNARVEALTPEALELIGQEPNATTTHPFDTDQATGEAS